MGEITELLQADQPEEAKLEAVFQRLYPELKVLARARLANLAAGQTLTPTALVNEAYVKLVQAERLDLNDRRHFFACAARAMRHIVVDHARAAAAGKRGGDAVAITFSEELPAPDHMQMLLDLNQALDELNRINPDFRELAELRYYGGLTLGEVAELRAVSVRTITREWQRARAFLHTRLADLAG